LPGGDTGISCFVIDITVLRAIEAKLGAANRSDTIQNVDNVNGTDFCRCNRSEAIQELIVVLS
jgi:hypothetical protein